MSRQSNLIPQLTASSGWGQFALLARTKGIALRNQIDQALAQSPLKVIAICLFILIIWASLYGLFYSVFWMIKKQALASILAVPYVFGFFFVALMAMLTLSNAVLIYGSLFRHAESAYLLATPTDPLNIVATKYLESLFFSSWAMLLLGVPLMLAMANLQFVPWYFYPLFIGLFLFFIAIPGAWGLLAAWLVAMYLPRTLGRAMVLLAIAGAVAFAWYLIDFAQHGAGWLNAEVWLQRFFGELRFVRSALLPSAWVTAGLTAAAEQQPVRGVFYLFITFANAVFFSWLAIVITARRLATAYSRAGARSGRKLSGRAWPSALLTSLLFFYIPSDMRTLIRKDVRNFLRDPTQWTQLFFLMGLLAIYAANIPNLRVDISTVRWQLLISFLNTATIGFILATFTSRFVFPMLSLEGDTMWMLGLLPLSARRIMLAKFVFAMTIATISAAVVSVLSCRSLQASWGWTAFQLTTAMVMCVGLCGLGVGIGAWLPLYGQRNTARIASGFGGTVNLIFSMIYVCTTAAGFGWICLRALKQSAGGQIHLDTLSILIMLGMVALALATAAAAMTAGTRALTRREY